jgi:hypothetical protein
METSPVKPEKSPLERTHKHYMRGAREIVFRWPAPQARKTRGFFCCLMDSHCLDAFGQVRRNDKPFRGEGEREARTDAVGLQRFPMHNPETRQIC